MKKASRTMKNLCAAYKGLTLYTALQRISADFPELRTDDIVITYSESPLPRFTVLSCHYEKPSCLRITAASANPLRYLPSNYQDNAFLRGFLMVFQHIANDTLLTIDNLSSWFRPMECPVTALAELALWLGADAETMGSEEELRRLLQLALPLYRLRGTPRGIASRLSLACGLTPIIIEGQLPRALRIQDEGETENTIFETESAENCFTVHFPASRMSFSEAQIHRVSRIMKQEKPAHTRCFISFDPARKRRKLTTLHEETRLENEPLGEGFYI